jgi:glycosyltransferase involved in cell wall biosynthesis
VLEAMAAGTPQVLTDVGGNREAAGDAQAALLVPPHEPRALAQALLRVLDDRGVARALREGALARVRRFTIEEQVRRTEELYLELARRRGLLA